MTKDWTAVPVPAPPLLLKEFLAMEQKHYVRTLEVVRDEVSKAVQPLGVYKIYGRDEKQRGVLLKDARKARLKFNDHFMKRKESLGSLWVNARRRRLHSRRRLSLRHQRGSRGH